MIRPNMKFKYSNVDVEEIQELLFSSSLEALLDGVGKMVNSQHNGQTNVCFVQGSDQTDY